jgi:nucleoside-diphosphate-sugar epimerase
MNTMLTNKSILITGGNGFVAGHLADVLARAGNFVDLFDIAPNLSGTARSLNLHRNENIRYISGDVLEPNCFSALEKHYDYVVHAAAILGIKRVCEESILTLDVNIMGTRNCLNYCSGLRGLKRVLMFSTSEVYGPSALAANEDQDLVVAEHGMRWCYAVSKLATEQLTKAYHMEFGVPYVIVRPFNVYGPYREGSNAVSSFVKNAQKRQPIVLSDCGEQKRAWCYIDDFVDGLIRCLAMQEACNQTFNIGNSSELYSIRELAELVCQIVGVTDGEIRSSGSVEPDVKERSPNIEKAKRLLGFNPSVSLEQGLRATIYPSEQSGPYAVRNGDAIDAAEAA